MLARIDHDVEADDFHAKRLPSSSRTPDDRSWICNALCFKKDVQPLQHVSGT